MNTITRDGQTYVLTFQDEFDGNSGSYWQGFGSDGIWSTSYSPHLEDMRWLTSNNEQQFYVDPDDPNLASPFTVSGGVMTIHASELTAAEQAFSDGQDYASGLLTTEMTFGATSGYIEISADIPDQVGFWSSFWLLPADGDWSSEIDVFEILGHDADTVYTNAWVDGVGHSVAIDDTDAGNGFHTYGLQWDDTGIEWFIDGQLVRSSTTTITEEMYLSLSLAVGGWAGDTDATTDFTDGMSIDYVRVYELDSNPDRNEAILAGDSFKPSKKHGGTDADNTLFGSRWADELDGMDGNDLIYARKGDDTVTGGSGNDEIYGERGNDTLLGEAGDDKLIGGKGSDVLEGGAGTDHLWGGSYGSDTSGDTFVFTLDNGKDFVHDYTAGSDLIDLTAFNTDWASVQSAIVDVGWATKLEFGHLGEDWTDMAYLIGVDAVDLSASDFIFDVAMV
ncbi:MAG: family 16 glycosylhydrolase [Pseudomonadota bacterium]